MPPRSADTTPTSVLATEAQRHLRTRRLGRPMEGHATLGSTSTRALAWARDGAAEGSTVVTDHQTDGRGRHGRRWHAQAGLSLTFSVVLRPGDAALPAREALSARSQSLVPLAAGLAVCDAVADLPAMPAPRLKWPNDVLIGGRKCCGVLVETFSSGRAAGPLVLGVGLNVNQQTLPEVPGGGRAPTSLALAGGRPVARAPLLARLLGCIEARYLSLFADGGRAVLDGCEACLAGLGERVSIRRPGAPPEAAATGTLLGLAPDGALRVQTNAGERTFHAGDVTTA